jgi:hypothetical protein
MRLRFDGQNRRCIARAFRTLLAGSCLILLLCRSAIIDSINAAIELARGVTIVFAGNETGRR